MVYTKLPPEIWLIIFRFATETLDCHAVESGFVSDLDGSLDLDTHWRMLAEHPASKLSLSFVCRAWCNLVTPLIYEQIVIKDFAQENLLLRTLDTSPRKLGHFVRALFIGVGVHVSISVRTANMVVKSLLKHTPKVKVYGFRCAHIFARPIGCTGLTGLTPQNCQLTSLTLHTHPGVVPATLYMFLEKFSASLRTLETSLPRLSSDPSAQERILHFPKLHTFTIVQGGDAGALVEVAHRWIMPALKSIRGLGNTSTFPFSIFLDSPDDTPRITSSEGVPKITSVMYSGARPCNNLYENFTSIEDIVFEVEIGRRPVLLMQQPIPSCTRVGISTHEVPKSKRRLQVTAISDQFTPLSNPVIFPKLRVIRVMFFPSQEKWIEVDSRPAKAFFEDHKERIFWAYWVKLWASRGVRLEAVEPHTGMPVPTICELNSDSALIASEYERFWGHRNVGHGESSSEDEDSSEDLFSDEDGDSDSDMSGEDGDSDDSD